MQIGVQPENRHLGREWGWRKACLRPALTLGLTLATCTAHQWAARACPLPHLQDRRQAQRVTVGVSLGQVSGGEHRNPPSVTRAVSITAESFQPRLIFQPC